MPLDFNTLEPKGQQNQEKKRESPSGSAIVTSMTPTAIVILALCLALSLASVILSLYSIKNMPKPGPVIVQCDPNLLQKIENQARVLDEISKSAKSEPSSKIDKN